MATAASTTGVGQGSALKAGVKGWPNATWGVEHLVGPRIVFAGTFTMTGATNAITFPQTLPGVAADYMVVASAAHAAQGTSMATTGFTLNGTSADVVSYIVVRVSAATVASYPTVN